jgi:ABC-type transporter Mla subunit MlaD
MRPDPRFQVRLGLAAAGLLVVVVAFLAFVPDPFMRQKVHRTTFDDVAAVTPGAPVYFRGATLGSVRSVELDPQRNLFDVRLGLRRDWTPPRCSFARIVETNPFIAPRIELVAPEAPAGSSCAAVRRAAACEVLPDGRTGRVLDGCSRQEDLLELAAGALAQATTTIESANTTLARIDTAVRGVTGGGGGGAASSFDVQGLLANVETTAASLEDITGKLNATLSARRQAEIADTVGNVRTITEQAARFDVGGVNRTVAGVNSTVTTANATLAEVQGMLAANRASLERITSEGAGLTAESRELLATMSASMAGAAASMERASENLEALSERLGADPTYAVRGARYSDPPPPGGGRPGGARP